MEHFRQIQYRYFSPDKKMVYQQPGEAWSVCYEVRRDKETGVENTTNCLRLDGFVTEDFMQFTGQKNKDGVEIFEGDIVQLGENGDYPAVTGKVGVVYWCESQGQFMVKWNWSKNQHDIDLTEDVAYGAKVLGNVFENPNYPLSNGNLWR